jgi:hypothetical protein
MTGIAATGGSPVADSKWTAGDENNISLLASKSTRVVRPNFDTVINHTNYGQCSELCKALLEECIHLAQSGEERRQICFNAFQVCVTNCKRQYPR